MAAALYRRRQSAGVNLCALDGRIPGTERPGRSWAIPADAVKLENTDPGLSRQERLREAAGSNHQISTCPIFLFAHGLVFANKQGDTNVGHVRVAEKTGRGGRSRKAAGESRDRRTPGKPEEAKREEPHSGFEGRCFCIGNLWMFGGLPAMMKKAKEK